MKISKTAVSIACAAVGMIGVAVTSVISIKCRNKEIEAEKEIKKETSFNELELKDKAKIYIPALISGGATMAFIGAGCLVGTKEIARLTAAGTSIATAFMAHKQALRGHSGEAVEIDKEFLDTIDKEAASIDADYHGLDDRHKKNGYFIFCDKNTGFTITAKLPKVKNVLRTCEDTYNSSGMLGLGDYLGRLAKVGHTSLPFTDISNLMSDTTGFWGEAGFNAEMYRRFGEYSPDTIEFNIEKSNLSGIDYFISCDKWPESCAGEY